MTDISVPIDDDLEGFVNQEVRALSLNLLTGLVRTTPVDTGRAKGNWYVSPTTKSNRTIDQFRKDRQAISQGAATIHSVINEKFPNITLSNNLPYIERLNDGYSLQAPKKFVETEINRVVNASNLNVR